MIEGTHGYNLEQTGQGDAAIFDTKNLPNYAVQAENRNHAARNSRSKGLFGSLDKLNHLDIWENDQPYFAKKAEAVYKAANEGGLAQRIIKNNDPQAIMQMQRMLGEIDYDANISKAKKQQIQATDKDILTQQQQGNTIIPEDLDNYLKHRNSVFDVADIDKGGKPSGTYDTSKIGRLVPLDKLAKQFDTLVGDKQETEVPTANGGTIKTKTYSPKQIADAAVNLMSTHENAATVNHLFDALPEESNTPSIPSKEKYLKIDSKGKVETNGNGDPVYNRVAFAQDLFKERYKNDYLQTPDRKPEEANNYSGENTKTINGATWQYYKDKSTGEQTVTVDKPKTTGTIGFVDGVDQDGNKVSALQVPANQPFSMIKKPGTHQFLIQVQDKDGQKYTFPYSPANSDKIKDVYHYNPEALAIDFNKSNEGEKTVAQPAAGTSHSSHSTEKIKVKRKSDGRTGTIDAKDFNDSKYDKL